MEAELLKEIILAQHMAFESMELLVKRDILDVIREYVDLPQAIVISGLRRAGKSTLLKEIKHAFYPDQNVYYFNFEDERLLKFTVDDFDLLHECFLELYGKLNVFFFDEIQNVTGWEVFVRRMQDAGYKFYITGSNASMLSKELGTRLTGRYIGIELFPFSFKEYLAFKEVVIPDHFFIEDRAKIKKYFEEYIKTGGIPEYVIYKKEILITMLYDNILYRDVLARYKISDQKSLKELAFYLISNPGTLISYNKLKVMLNIGSVNTIKDHISFIENAYMIFTINKHDSSVKRQLYANKKIYVVDTGFIQLLAFKFPKYTSKVLENIIFMELKRRGKNIYYYKNKHECDFVVVEKNVVIEAIQVTTTLGASKKREYDGLIEVMTVHNLPQGLIITDEEDFEDEVDGKKIVVRPAWKWLIGTGMNM